MRCVEHVGVMPVLYLVDMPLLDAKVADERGVQELLIEADPDRFNGPVVFALPWDGTERLEVFVADYALQRALAVLDEPVFHPIGVIAAARSIDGQLLWHERSADVEYPGAVFPAATNFYNIKNTLDQQANIALQRELGLPNSRPTPIGMLEILDDGLHIINAVFLVEGVDVSHVQLGDDIIALHWGDLADIEDGVVELSRAVERMI